MIVIPLKIAQKTVQIIEEETVSGFGESFMNNPWTVGIILAVFAFFFFWWCVRWKDEFYGRS